MRGRRSSPSAGARAGGAWHQPAVGDDEAEHAPDAALIHDSRSSALTASAGPSAPARGVSGGASQAARGGGRLAVDLFFREPSSFSIFLQIL